MITPKRKKLNKLVDVNQALRPLLDPTTPPEHFRMILLQACMEEGDPAQLLLLEALREAARRGQIDDLVSAKLEEVETLLAELKRGPIRSATFLLADPSEGEPKRAVVRMEEGQKAFPVLPDDTLLKKLRRGESVLVDIKESAVLGLDPSPNHVGELGRLERRVDDEHIVVSMNEHQPLEVLTSATLADRLDSGEVRPGAQVLVCPRRGMAWEALGADQGPGEYQYLVLGPVPDVVAGRDIAHPPACLRECGEHVRREMTKPALGRRYRLRRLRTWLCVGKPGSGKTLTVLAAWRMVYEVMSELTGVPVDQLPNRVLRLRSAEVLSKWLGESDKKIDRLFDEVERLSDEVFVTPDGREFHLPVIVIGEEIDALARTRGAGEDVHDRIMSTLLQRLDPNWGRTGDRLVLFFFTTNLQQHVDPAMLRRAGGKVVNFGSLDRRSFAGVIRTHLGGMPLAVPASVSDPLGYTVDALTDWLFAPTGHDDGVVELTYAGTAATVVKHRHDFLIGALVDRAVQQAAATACEAEHHGRPDPGVSLNLLRTALDDQIRSAADQLSPVNAHNFLDLPEGERVARIRRLPRPILRSFELERPA
jgi:ATP-dependent 26S proteasome regulatory subunit